MELGMNAIFIGSLGVWSREGYYLWNAGFPCHLKVNIGREDLGLLRGDLECVFDGGSVLEDMTAAVAVGAGSHDI